MSFVKLRALILTWRLKQAAPPTGQQTAVLDLENHSNDIVARVGGIIA